MTDNSGQEKLIVDQEFLLEKYPGKGGWTYVVIPRHKDIPKAKFGWVRVKGQIDSFVLKGYKLMPMANGNLFLPIKADIRKVIKKEEGDYVYIKLFEDHDPLEIPFELQICLEDNPEAYSVFKQFTESEQKQYIDWILSAKQEITKVDRIAKTIIKLEKGLKYMDRY